MIINRWNWKSLSRVWLFVTPQTVACQAPLPMGFSRREYWSGFPSPGGSSWPRNRTGASSIAGRLFTSWVTKETSAGESFQILSYCFWMFCSSPSFFYYFYLVVFFCFLLYNTVLVLPYVNMNPPRVYISSHSWTPLPPLSPYHPSGLSQCTSPKHPVSCIEPRLAICFLYDIIHVSISFLHLLLSLFVGWWFSVTVFFFIICLSTADFSL